MARSKVNADAQLGIKYEMQFGANCNIEEAKNWLLDMAKSDERGSESIIIWGDPGLGKTAIVKQICKEIGVKYRRYNMSTVDYLQLAGIPELIPGAKGNKKAVRYPILDIPADGEGILCLDDFTHAIPAVQNIALDLALERMLNDAHLGPGWMLVLCANHEGGTHPMQPPIANRLRHLFVRMDYQAWRKWALLSDVRQEVIGYLDTNNMVLYQSPEKQEKAFPTPRSWEALSRAMDKLWGVKMRKTFEVVDEELQVDGSIKKVKREKSEIIFDRPDLRDADQLKLGMTINSTVGAGVGADFLGYLNTYGMVDFEKVIEGTHPKLQTLCKSAENKDAEVQALEYAVVARARGWWSTKAKVGGGRISRAKALGNILKLLEPHFQSMAIRDFNFTDSSRMNQVINEVKKHTELQFVQDLFYKLGEVMAERTL